MGTGHTTGVAGDVYVAPMWQAARKDRTAAGVLSSVGIVTRPANLSDLRSTWYLKADKPERKVSMIVEARTIDAFEVGSVFSTASERRVKVFPPVCVRVTTVLPSTVPVRPSA
eukprot:4955510-Amphidinium_carterae.1